MDTKKILKCTRVSKIFKKNKKREKGPKEKLSTNFNEFLKLKKVQFVVCKL